LQTNQLFREHLYSVNAAGGPTNVHPRAAFSPTQILKRPRENGELGLSLRVVFVDPRQDADPSHALALLRPRYDRPRRRAAEPRDELPPSHRSSLMLLCAEPIAVGVECLALRGWSSNLFCSAGVSSWPITSFAAAQKYGGDLMSMIRRFWSNRT
jgi:hypothetical protein